MNVIALDIGGTKIYAARYNKQLQIEAEIKVPTEAKSDQKNVCKNILSAIDQVRNNDTKAIGVSWAGFVDSKNGIILKAPNIPALNNFGITQFLKNETNIPTFLENDARCFALAQQKKSFPESDVLIGIIIGTGVGTGIIINEEPFGGSHGSAGEIGHIQIHGSEVEEHLAGPGLQKLLGVDQLSLIDDHTNDPEIIKKIEPKLEIMTDWLSYIVLAFDPKKIVIGGGAGKHFWSHFEEQIIKRTNQKLEKYPVSLDLAFSKLKNAGADGAATLALKKI